MTIEEYIKALRKLAGNASFVLLREEDGSLTLPMSINAAAEYLYNGSKPTKRVLPSELIAEQLDLDWSDAENKRLIEYARAAENEYKTRSFYSDVVLPLLTGGASSYIIPTGTANVITNPALAAVAATALNPMSRIIWPLAGLTALASWYTATNDMPSILPMGKKRKKRTSGTITLPGTVTNPEGTVTVPGSAEVPRDTVSTGVPSVSTPSTTPRDTVSVSTPSTTPRDTVSVSTPSTTPTSTGASPEDPNKKKSVVEKNKVKDKPKLSFLDKWKSRRVTGYVARHPFKSLVVGGLSAYPTVGLLNNYVKPGLLNLAQGPYDYGEEANIKRMLKNIESEKIDSLKRTIDILTLQNDSLKNATIPNNTTKTDTLKNVSDLFSTTE